MSKVSVTCHGASIVLELQVSTQSVAIFLEQEEAFRIGEAMIRASTAPTATGPFWLEWPAKEGAEK